MRIEVVFDYRQARLAGGLNRLADLVDFLIAPRPPVDGVVEAADHGVEQSQSRGLRALDGGPYIGFLPWKRAPNATPGDIIDAELLDAPHAGFIAAASHIDVGCVGPFDNRPLRRRGGSGSFKRRRQGRGTGGSNQVPS